MIEVSIVPPSQPVLRARTLRHITDALYFLERDKYRLFDNSRHVRLLFAEKAHLLPFITHLVSKGVRFSVQHWHPQIVLPTPNTQPL
ncbi:hypothetical protein [Eisenibacter elegans]|jgi:hypothetical protein|uniref:hypothetical protein n=1 Tax=Eisenibacter elegans TaxID=997 RepID=UPI0003FBB6DD|nr:hypothetical protein [Eisenibacter elegans]